MSQFNYTQLPPDGTGKRVTSINTVEFKYTYLGGTVFAEGDNVVNATRKLDGNIIKIKGDEIYVVLNRSLATPMANGDIITVAGVEVATFDSLEEDVRSQSVVLVGGNNTLNNAHVNDTGALVPSFATGDPSFDAFGKLQTSESTTIREYQPTVDTMPDEFTEETALGGTVTWDDQAHVVQLYTPSGNLGALARRRSNLYHKYQTGVATTVMFSGYIGGANIGCERRWGLFDDDDGLFFYADGDV